MIAQEIKENILSKKIELERNGFTPKYLCLSQKNYDELCLSYEKYLETINSIYVPIRLKDIYDLKIVIDDSLGDEIGVGI